MKKSGPFFRISMFAVTALAAIFASVVAVSAQNQKPSGLVQPAYQIFDMGLVLPTDTNAQAFGISPLGIGVGRSIRTGGAQAYSWTVAGGLVGLPLLSGRTFCVANSANDFGAAVGTCGTTLFGSSRLPTLWQNGLATQLPMPAGETLGDANDINSNGVAVGSVNGGSLQKAVYYSGGTATYISQTTSGGSFFVTAFGINDSGRIVGQGIDPNNLARNVGIVYDIGSGSATEVGALPGQNGALAFGISNSGFVVGASSQNQSNGLPFIWSPGGGMVAIPLPVGTSQGSARGVNSAGWVVGTASSAFAIPFVYNGTATYRVADLIPAGTGWDLSTNTSSSALGISEGNVIVGTGILNGAVHGYAMVPVAVSVSGSVRTTNGAGVRNVRVTISGGGLSAPRTVTTGNFGNFRLSGVPSTATYTVTVTTKKYVIAQPSRTTTPLTDVVGFDFTANAN